MITVLGRSEATLTMITDNLESSKWFAEIKIINNLKRSTTTQYINDRFEYSEEYELKTKEGYFILGVTKPENKLEIYNFFNVSDEYFINVIHRSSQISSTARLGKGLIINSLVSIAAHARFGNHVTLNSNCSIGSHCRIGSFSTLSSGCNLGGSVKIGENTSIGMSTSIRDGVTIGSNCIIGMGSVVLGDVPDNTKIYGLIK